MLSEASSSSLLPTSSARSGNYPPQKITSTGQHSSLRPKHCIPIKGRSLKINLSRNCSRCLDIRKRVQPPCWRCQLGSCGRRRRHRSRRGRPVYNTHQMPRACSQPDVLITIFPVWCIISWLRQVSSCLSAQMTYVTPVEPSTSCHTMSVHTQVV